MPEWIQQHSSEPVSLNRMFLAGCLLAIVSLNLLVLSGIAQGTGNLKCTPVCKPQLERRNNDLKELRKSKESALLRIAVFTDAMNNLNDRNFAAARTQIIEEEKNLEKIKSKIQNLEIEPISIIYVFATLFAVLLTISIAFATSHLMLKHADGSVLSSGKEIEEWSSPYWILVALLFIPHLAREFFTSVYPIGKLCFGWMSFCVNSTAWVVMQVMFLGLAMVVAHPVCILWCLGRSNYRPQKLIYSHPDGSWGVKSYVLFLQTWTILGITLFLLPTLLFLRVFAPREILYVVPSSINSVIICLVVGRLVFNAVKIRQTYGQALKGLGKTWQKIASRNPPTDPTNQFLGEHWWKLPATIFGLAGVLWTIIKWSGVLDGLTK